MQAEWESCFAYEGMTALGVSDRYECGMMLRIDTWLNALGIKFEVDPKVTGCVMHTDSKFFLNTDFSSTAEFYQGRRNYNQQRCRGCFSDIADYAFNYKSLQRFHAGINKKI
jgi:hypothetical protein